MLDNLEELKRKPVELNLAAARKRKSAQTGFIHFCYTSLPLEQQDTIPLYENFCYALALLRSRLSDHVLEAKSLLEKLIAFEVGGNFPIYLHEYPQCKDRSLSVHLLPVLFWALEDFSSVLGETLSAMLQDLFNRILIHAERVDREKPLPLTAWAKWKACTDPEQIKALSFNAASEWGDYLIALQIAQAKGVEISQDVLRVGSRWNAHFHQFLGRHAQEKTEPEVTLFDLFLGHAQQKFSRRVSFDHSAHLRAALIQTPLTLLLASAGSSPYAHFTTEDPRQGFIACWGNEQTTHSLSCEHRGALLDATLTEASAQLCFKLKEGWEPSEQPEIPLSFFCNLSDAHTLFINGKKGTTFQLGDTVEIVTGNQRIEIVVSCSEGEGVFFGHLLRANRPTQQCNVGPCRFEAYDCLLAIRTVKRSSSCTLVANLARSDSPAD